MPGETYRCLYDVLFKGPQPDDMVAIRDIGRAPLTMGQLRRHIAETVGRLNAMGFRRNDRIAVVMPAGPELLVTLLSVAAGFTVVPINSYYSFDEYKRCLAQLGARALIVRAGSDSPAAYAAQFLGMRVVEISPEPGLGLGLFSLVGEATGPAPSPSFAQPDDLMFILFTAGTTARPKMVPFSHGRFCGGVSAYAEKNSHLNYPGACNVCIMPMFHLHGLMLPIGSLAVGVSVACPPGISVPLLIAYLREFTPAWGSVGVALLHGLLEYGYTDPSFSLPETISHFDTGGSHLPPQLARAFEARFGLPVVNRYGMSESLLVTSNSPAMARAKPGSVGKQTVTEIRIRDETGRFLGPGETGEIVLRGPLVITGYLNDPAENARAFVDGWLRTGDTGYLDADGYLYITGRILERINKGGEKVSPGEIEEILLSHPAVSEAVVFPVPDPAYGENIGAAVVLKRGMAATPTEIIRHVSGKAAYFKIPSGLWIVDSIPRGPAGKVQRNGLHKTLERMYGVNRLQARDVNLPAAGWRQVE